MAFPGETLASGAKKTCPECLVTPKLEVLMSPAGFYIGTMCDCGPYSRESFYYPDRKTAERELEHDTWERR